MLAKKASLIGRYLFFLTCLYSCNWFTVAVEMSQIRKEELINSSSIKNKPIEEENDLIEEKTTYLAVNNNSLCVYYFKIQTF